VLYVVFALALVQNYYKTRELYVRSLYSYIITASFHPIIHKIHTSDPIYVYDGIYEGDISTINIFDRSVSPVHTIKDLSAYVNHANKQHDTNATKTDEGATRVESLSTNTIDPDDDRVEYLRRNLILGYPQETLRKALIDAGNAPQLAYQLLQYAKQHPSKSN
jgi:hypothetical protein